MAKGINLVVLAGNLGQDPEIRYMPSGTAVGNLSLATGEARRDPKTGKLLKETEWHRVVVFGKQAEIAGQYLKKGAKCGVTGKLKTRKYTDQEGILRYVTEIRAADLTLLDSKQRSDDSDLSDSDEEVDHYLNELDA